MSLSAARGPLSAEPFGTFSPPIPPAAAYVEPHLRRVVAVLDGTEVIDTERSLLVHRAGRALAYAFPAGEVGGLPHTPVPEAPGYVEVPWDAVDAWFEEGRRLVHYPPNPYHRVDYRPTRRRLRVEVAGTVLVDTDDTVACFETALAPKLYVHPHHVRTDLLRPSATTTYCNYKGWTTYWDAVVDGTVVADAAWSYDDPLPESTPIRGLLAFEPTVVTVRAELPEAGGLPDTCTTECEAPPRRAGGPPG